MASSGNSSSSSGIGVFGLLGVAFVILKLTGVIDWAWLWVLAPFWIGAALWLLFVVVALGVVAIIASVDRRSYKPRGRIRK
jgi:hypothetical protein